MTHPSKPESKNKRSWSDGDLAVLGGVSGFVAWLASTRMGATANYLDVVDQAETSARWSSLLSNLNLVQTLSSMRLLATVGVGAICSVVIGSWLIRSKRNNATDKTTPLSEPPSCPSLPSALLPCITSHRRLLPTPAKHAFSYPLIYMGIDLDELESHKLDLPSRFFRYGTSRSILGLRHEHYLAPAIVEKEARRGAWKEELKTLVSAHGVPGEEMGRVWMVTMPSYIGFVGVNPLSVYFCYKDEAGKGDGDKEKSAGLLCVVLEVHNTFEERHLYVLRTSHDEVNPQGNHDHAWVFPRTFHVSPFNNRAGFYRLDVQDPFSRSSTEPRIKVTLNQLTQEKETKLYAALLNHPDKTRRPVDITIINILKVVLWRQPWDLFLTTFRILRQAWTLHYRKKLLVYPRPELHTKSTMESEPIGPAEELPGHSLKVPWNPVQVDVGGIGRSIGFRAVDAAEKKAEGLLLPGMTRRAEEEGINVEIRFADPSRGVMKIELAGTAKSQLIVETRHPALFIQLLMARTPKHFLLTAQQEGHTSISSEEIFERLMTPKSRPESATSGLVATIKERVDAVRAAHLMFLLSFCDQPIPPEIVVIHKQQRHLADPSGFRQNLSILFILASLFFADKIEEKIFRVVKAKFIPGQEPWTVWKRTVDSIWRGQKDDDGEFALRGDREYGSVLLSDAQSVS